MEFNDLLLLNLGLEINKIKTLEKYPLKSTKYADSDNRAS